ncbi:hypothetical protein D7X12_11670 [Corallococcus sicarius]|uniref:Uncharacterized protein n=1 Tax=Corallococcus sicarius TaxID=2316726 RepID=A0A3A8NI15_9BACT|nr:hypothetical protein D7X12_11670 [Corallococcus sicarius]
MFTMDGATDLLLPCGAGFVRSVHRAGAARVLFSLQTPLAWIHRLSLPIVSVSLGRRGAWTARARRRSHPHGTPCLRGGPPVTVPAEVHQAGAVRDASTLKPASTPAAREHVQREAPA